MRLPARPLKMPAASCACRCTWSIFPSRRLATCIKRALFLSGPTGTLPGEATHFLMMFQASFLPPLAAGKKQGPPELEHKTYGATVINGNAATDCADRDRAGLFRSFPQGRAAGSMRRDGCRAHAGAFAVRQIISPSVPQHI